MTALARCTRDHLSARGTGLEIIPIIVRWVTGQRVPVVVRFGVHHHLGVRDLNDGLAVRALGLLPSGLILGPQLSSAHTTTHKNTHWITISMNDECRGTSAGGRDVPSREARRGEASQRSSLVGLAESIRRIQLILTGKVVLGQRALQVAWAGGVAQTLL